MVSGQPFVQEAIADRYRYMLTVRTLPHKVALTILAVCTLKLLPVLTPML